MCIYIIIIVIIIIILLIIIITTIIIIHIYIILGISLHTFSTCRVFFGAVFFLRDDHKT